MRNRPTIDELRAALDDFHVAADPSAPVHAFYSRVAENVTALIAREVDLGPAFEAAERQRLRILLGVDGDLEGLNRALCAAIRSGELAAGDPALLHHLRLTARENLAIDNPRYASYRRDIGDE
jgi:hypothetical protein